MLQSTDSTGCFFWLVSLHGGNMGQRKAWKDLSPFQRISILFGISVHDTQAGIKLFRRKVIETILPKLVEKKFCGDLEMLVVAKACGYGRIYEAPIKLNYQFASVTTASTLQSIRGMFLDTLAIWYRRYVLKFYN